MIRKIITRECIHNDNIIRLDPSGKLGLKPLARIAEDDILLRGAV